MLKYCFKVYDKYTGDLISQVVTNVDNMLDTLTTLNKLGMVKGFILDEKESEENK